MQATLPDGTALELPAGATGADAAAAIGPGLARAALAVVVDGEPRDLARPLPDGARVEVVTKRSPEALELVRHDAAHVLAEALLELYPGIRIAIGPPIEHGFYYDVEPPAGTVITEGDLPRIEERMREHVRADEAFAREDLAPDAAIARFRAEDQPYKVELIEDLVAAARDRGEELESVSLYTNGAFTDLCRGPHAPSTGAIGALRLQSVAGAYWRGDSRRTQLTRIYGTAFFSVKELDAHLERLELARARDHRRLGRELDLYHFSPAAPGSAFWTPRGTRVYNALVALSREMGDRRGYTEVRTPQLYDRELWVTSGHWAKYRGDMFLTESGDERQMGLKPMNCPGHFELFRQSRWSWRDLPARFSEPGQLHRNELSGVLHGLLRVRAFCQDDAHLFCAPEQLQDELRACLAFARETYDVFGFDAGDIAYELSLRPEDRLGDDAQWDLAEGELRTALDALGLTYRTSPGEGAFYGPKIDIHFTDSLGRSWQLGTVQLDYGNAERFDLTYTGADNHEHRPVIVHRALMGSYERFLGILLEHTGGDLPLWLHPDHVVLLTVADRHADAARAAADVLAAAGVRARVDDRSESVGRKVREAELAKAPLSAVVGDREAAEGTLVLRRRGGAEDPAVPVADVAAALGGRIARRAAR